MKKITLNDIKNLSTEAKAVGPTDGKSIVKKIELATSMDIARNIVPGDLVCFTEDDDSQIAGNGGMARHNGREMWSYSLWSFKYRECTNKGSLSDDAKRCIEELADVMSRYDDSVLSEFTVMKKRR